MSIYLTHTHGATVHIPRAGNAGSRSFACGYAFAERSRAFRARIMRAPRAIRAHGHARTYVTRACGRMMVRGRPYAGDSTRTRTLRYTRGIRRHASGIRRFPTICAIYVTRNDLQTVRICDMRTYPQDMRTRSTAHTHSYAGIQVTPYHTHTHAHTPPYAIHTRVCYSRCHACDAERRCTLTHAYSAATLHTHTRRAYARYAG